MDKPQETIRLLNSRKQLTDELSNLLWGSVEVRDGKIYLHRRENGFVRTVYVGLETSQLLDQINRDNVAARKLKKQLRLVNAQLDDNGYTSGELSDGVKRNIDFARRNMVASIYDQAVLEGVAVTYSNTETIIERGLADGISVEDVQKINNLKHAWELILDEGVVQSPSDFNLLCLINKTIIEGLFYEAGKLRSIPVRIGGTTWQPHLPIESRVREDIERINQINDVYERAVKALLYVMRSQLFIDGNKRTGVIFANHILIKNGAGLMVVPNDLVPEFKKLLVQFYETNDDSIIKDFLLAKCLVKL